jgi:hypothetical protein
MTGHRHGQPRRDKARAERMRTRIATAENEFQAMGHAFDWLRMELQHLGRAGTGRARTQQRPGEASVIARQVMRELVAHTEHVIQRSND